MGLIKFLFGMGIPRLPKQRHLSRAWSQKDRVYDPRGISPTICSQEIQGRYHILVSTQMNGTNMQIQSTKNTSERLTPTECERLQGFPDGWCEFGHNGERISDTQRYKCMGNAVTTNVITEIGKRIADMVK